jgi:hypothetical protein
MKENNCYGHLYLRENLSFQNNYIIKELKIYASERLQNLH